MTRPPPPAARPAQPRSGALAQIHISKAQLGLDDGTYRDMLFAIARVRSAKDLDHAGRAKVLEHMKRCGWKPMPPKTKPAAGTVRAGEPHNLHSEARGPQLKKIEALLADAGRPWAYADGMAYRMFGIQRVAMCHEGQLHKMTAALMYDQARRKAKGG